MKNKLTVNELFSGIGAQRKALENLNIPYEIIGVSEIDKYAIQSYEAIFGQTRNYGDISQVEKLDYADLWTYSFPCTDISVAGETKGINENTRSGLLYQVQRLLEVAKQEETLPKYLLLENVKNLVGKQFKSQFDEWLQYLDDLGYNNYWKVLNAKDYGIPQNRERVFVVSIRKDLNQQYTFPEKMILSQKLKDILETEVNESFYLSQEQINGIKFSNFNVNKSRIQEKDICATLCARDFKDPKCVPIKNATKQGYILAEERKDSINLSFPNSNTRRGRVYSKEGVSPTLNCCGGGGLQVKILEESHGDLGIRKLTPLEYWRLMGFDDESFYKAKNSGVSNTQLYKQAGNSIVVNVLEEVFRNLLIEEK